MKSFIFRDWVTAKCFEWLMEEHRDKIKELSQKALGEGAKAITEPEARYCDVALDDDEKVFHRLATEIQCYVEEEAVSTIGFLPEMGTGFFSDLLAFQLEGIDYLRIAKAIYYGVEPWEPHVPTIPEML